jgi:hypothetical protein
LELFRSQKAAPFPERHLTNGIACSTSETVYVTSQMEVQRKQIGAFLSGFIHIHDIF